MNLNPPQRHKSNKGVLDTTSVPDLAPLLARAELVRAEAVAAVVAARRRREAPAQGPREQRDEAAPERAEVAAAARLALEAELLRQRAAQGEIEAALRNLERPEQFLARACEHSDYFEDIEAILRVREPCGAGG